MSVMFTEGRAFPAELRNSGMGHYRYGNSDQDGAAKIFDSISPFKFLEALFVTKPAQERAAQVALATQQAQALEVDTEARQKTMRTVVLVGSGLAGLMLIALISKRRSASVAGYRRKSRRSSRRSRR